MVKKDQFQKDVIAAKQGALKNIVNALMLVKNVVNIVNVATVQTLNEWRKSNYFSFNVILKIGYQLFI